MSEMGVLPLSAVRALCKKVDACGSAVADWLAEVEKTRTKHRNMTVEARAKRMGPSTCERDGCL